MVVSRDSIVDWTITCLEPRGIDSSRRGVVTALKPVRAEQVRRPEPPVALGVRGYYPLPGKFLKSSEILNAISCDLVHT